MSAKNTPAAMSFQASSARAARMLEDPSVKARATGIELEGKYLVASQLGDFAVELTKLVDEVEAQASRGSKTAISRVLVVPEVAFDEFGTMFLKADGAMSSANGTKDNTKFGIYGFTVTLKVAKLSSVKTFVEEMRAEVDALYARGTKLLDQIR